MEKPNYVMNQKPKLTADIVPGRYYVRGYEAVIPDQPVQITSVATLEEEGIDPDPDIPDEVIIIWLIHGEEVGHGVSLSALEPVPGPTLWERIDR